MKACSWGALRPPRAGSQSRDHKSTPTAGLRSRAAVRIMANVDKASRWHSQAQLVLYTERSGNVLCVSVAPHHGEGWMLMAAATTADRASASLGAVFEHHSHVDLGIKDDLAEAIRAAESFAAGWLASPSIAGCGCGQLEGVELEDVESALGDPAA